MTNVYILLFIGGSLGWVVTALLPPEPVHRALLRVTVGALVSFIAGLMANGGTLYSGLNITTIGSAIGAALIATGLSVAMFPRRPR